MRSMVEGAETGWRSTDKRAAHGARPLHRCAVPLPRRFATREDQLQPSSETTGSLITARACPRFFSQARMRFWIGLSSP